MKRKEIMLVSGIAVGIVIAFYLAVYKPASGEIQRLHGAMHTYQGLDVREQVTEETRLAKENEMRDLEDEVSRISGRLLSPDEGEIFMKELRQYCVKADVFDVSVKRKGLLNKGGRSYLSIGVRMRGTFEDIYSFLLAVETMKKNVWLDNIKLSRSIDQDGAVNLDLSLAVPQDLE
jgi:hypothetical protein